MSYYHLKLHLTKFGDPSGSIAKKYAEAIEQRNQQELPDAGFDLFVPSVLECVVEGRSTFKLNHEVKASMTWVRNDGNEMCVAYYLYPRSSTGTKTPLRLANSVGIMDAGYRGPLIAALDNWSNEPYEIEEGQRLVQICPPDLSNYPLYVSLVKTEEELGVTERGEGGFGSTGV